MARPKIESVVTKDSKYVAAVDVKGIGKGVRSLRALFSPNTQSFTPLLASCDVRRKEFEDF